MNAAENSAFWTNARVDLLIKLWNEGDSARDIAEKLGAASRVAIVGKVFRLRKQGVKLREKPMQEARSPRAIFAPTRVQNRPKSAPRPPQVVIPEQAFDPLPSSNPRPWTERGSDQCNWPVGDGMSCCEKVHAFGWCETHVAVGRKPTTPAHELARSLRRWTA